MDIATLQRLSARTWPGLEQGRLGDWELRAAGGFTGRANSALPLGDPGVEVAAAIQRVGDWYRRRGLAPRLQVPDTLAGSGLAGPAAEVAEWCDSQGWAAEPWTLVMVREPGPAPESDGLQLLWSDEPDPAWLYLYHYRGAQLPESALRVITAAPARYLKAELDGALIGIGRVALVDEIVVLTAIEVVAEHRRQGYGAVITEALASQGTDAGGSLCVLQVFAHNTAAVALYQRLGYRPHHRYCYRYPTTV